MCVLRASFSPSHPSKHPRREQSKPKTLPSTWISSVRDPVQPSPRPRSAVFSASSASLPDMLEPRSHIIVFVISYVHYFCRSAPCCFQALAVNRCGYRPHVSVRRAGFPANAAHELGGNSRRQMLMFPFETLHQLYYSKTVSR